MKPWRFCREGDHMTAPRFDLPTTDQETQPFWDGLQDGKFLLRHCNACGRDHYYPRPFCPTCWSDDLSWKQWARRLQEYLELVERLLWPDLIIVGGGVSKKSEKFLPHIELRTEIVAAALHNDAGIVGAALHAPTS